MSDKDSFIAERKPEDEAVSSTPSNGHLLVSKSTNNDKISVTYQAQQSDKSKVGDYKSIYTSISQTVVNPDNQCSSTYPQLHPSALTGSTTKIENDKKESNDHPVSSPTSDHTSSSCKTHNPHAGSLSSNNCKNTNNTNDDQLLRCELCNRCFSKAVFNSKNSSAVQLMSEKKSVCPECNNKVPEGDKMAPLTPTKNLGSTPLTAHTNNAMVTKSSQCGCKTSHELNSSQTTKNLPTTTSPEMLKTIKTEPPNMPYAAICSTPVHNSHIHKNHTYQTKCSIYLTANLKPCGKRDKDSATKNEDPSLSDDKQNKKPKLDDLKSHNVEKTKSIVPDLPIKTEKCLSEDCGSDVKTFVVESKPFSNNQIKTQIKQEAPPVESSQSSFEFKPPTKPLSSSSSSGTTSSNKAKASCTSNTYMFEGSMLWKPVHLGEQEPTTSAPKMEGKEEKTETPSSTEKKEKDENTFSCEGSLFIKPVLPNEFAFEGTMFIKPDSPLLAQAPISFTNQPSAPGSSSTPQTTKTLTIQSLFTNSGQVISNIKTTSSGDKSGHVGSNGNSQQTLVTTSCVGCSPKCTLTSCCADQIKVKDKNLKTKTEPDTKPSLGFSQCQTFSTGGRGGGHTDFSVKSILSATDRRSSCESHNFHQH